MKATINSNNLVSALQKIGGCVKKHATIPILKCARIQINDNDLVLTTTDLEVTASTTTKTNAKGSLTTCIDHEWLVTLLKSTANQPVDLWFDDKNLTVNTKTGKYTCPLDDPKAWPSESPEDEFNGPIPTDAPALVEALTIGAKFVNNDPLVKSMNYVNLCSQDQALKVAATDKHIIFVSEVPVLNNTQIPPGIDLSISPAAIAAISQADFKETIDFSYSANMVVFSEDSTTIKVLTANEKYPNYEAVMVQNDEITECTFSRNDIKGVLARMQVVTNDMEVKTVVMDMKNGEMDLSSNNDFLHKTGHESITATLSGEPLTIGFLAHYLKWFFDTIREDQITLKLTHAHKLALATTKDFRMGIMPVMIAQ